MIIYFFRHMPTKNNLNNTFIGRLDMECDEHYIKEHKEEIKNISDGLCLSKLYCSPLKRARQTAELYFPQKTIVVDQRLIERDLGKWSDKSKAQICKEYPQAFFDNGSLNFSYTPEGAETFDSLIERVRDFIVEMYQLYSVDDAIGVVTHNGVITAIKCMLAGNVSTQNIKFQQFLVPFAVELDECTIQRIKQPMQI